jgi:hypothetical protein
VCKTKGKGKKATVTCTVTVKGAKAKAKLRWTLRKGRGTVARGTAVVRGGRVAIRLPASRLARGNYTLRISGRAGTTAVKVR